MRSTTFLAALVVLPCAAAALTVNAAPAAAAPATTPVVCSQTRSVDDYAPAVLDGLVELLELGKEIVPQGEIGLTCDATGTGAANLCAIAYTPGGTIAIGPTPRADGRCW